MGGKWVVRDGLLVGDQGPPGKGGFLITDGRYSGTNWGAAATGGR